MGPNPPSSGPMTGSVAVAQSVMMGTAMRSTCTKNGSSSSACTMIA
ncbi:Uncharacterised protein [Mycobacteroides abscessus subsp. abscessus]|nr:Uncharacterised protein [Mycobacteroides abscessus subsp. abscessus]